MYAYPYAYMPASTASLLGSSSLILSAPFGYLLVKNRVNGATVNAIVLIALDSDSDMHAGVTEAQYAMGFVWNVLGSVVHGIVFALSELVFVRWLGWRSFHVVLEQQVMVSLFGFVFTTIGLMVSSDFGGMTAEAEAFEGGRGAYVSIQMWESSRFSWGFLELRPWCFLHPPCWLLYSTRLGFRSRA